MDTHVHFFHPHRSPWLSRRLLSLTEESPITRLPAALFRRVGRGSARAERDLLIDPRTVGARFEPTDYAREAFGLAAVAGVPVSSVVHIESHWGRKVLDIGPGDDSALAETRYVAGLSFGVDGAPQLGALVVAGDPRRPDFARLIDRHLEVSPLVRGVRVKSARHPDQGVYDWQPADGLLVDPGFLSGFEVLAAAGLHFETMCYAHQLPEVDQLARLFPETAIVLNHFGLPAGAFGPIGAGTGATAAARADILRLWRERMSMLATRPNVHVKISGIAGGLLGYGSQRSGNIGGQHILAEMMGPLVLHVVDRFGADRVLFGSNLPFDTPNASLGVTVGALLDILGSRGDHLLRRFFAENAVELYGLPESSGRRVSESVQ